MKHIEAIHNIRKGLDTRTFYIYSNGEVEVQPGRYQEFDGSMVLNQEFKKYRMPKQNARILYGNKLAQGWAKTGKLSSYPIGGHALETKVVCGRTCVKTANGYVGID